MHNLTLKTTQVNIIISLNHVDIPRFIERLQTLLNEYNYSYAYILHNFDHNKDGELKTPHLHLILFNGMRKRLSTYINDISDFTHVSPLSITIDKCVSIEGSIQYLIHKNDIEKYQYNRDDIKTNIDSKELDLFLSTENGCLTFDRLFQIVRHAKNKTEVIEKIGLSYYRIYRPIICDIWNDYK